MSEVMIINGNAYEFKCGYRDEEVIRESFNCLTEETYGFNFRDWYDRGYWQDRYLPYSLLDQGEVVANISVNVMDFIILDERKCYIQIGTVMTKENYRYLGLSRALMERILEEWESQCDLIYLFANDSVLDFYPKFGFKPMIQYQYETCVFDRNEECHIQKLDMDYSADEALVYQIISQSRPISRLSMINNANLVMFYCLSFMRNHIYYLEDYNAIVIAETIEDTLYLQGVFSSNEINLDDVIAQIVMDGVKKVVFGFTPNDVSRYKKEVLVEEDSTLFVKIKNDVTFLNHDLRFPVLSHA